MSPVIELREIVRRYTVGRETVLALKGINLSIDRGAFASIVGPSGSGKSTLLNILGLLDRASSGDYKLDGIEVSQLTDEHASALRNRLIGFVFQSFHLLPRHTVLENVLLPRRFCTEPPAHCRERAEELLARFGLADRMNHTSEQLSGGQMQRVAIARALLLEPALLLADEPTGNLDSRTAGDVLELLKRLNAEGQTIVLVTHDSEVSRKASRRVHVRDGSIEFDETLY